MKKDIEIPVVENVAVAVVKELDEHNEEVWNAYLLNLKEVTIEGVIVSTKGYGVKEGEKVKTSILRHFWEALPGKSFRKIERITEELFKVNNEFWVSFYLNKKMYDKKYIFLREAINEKNLVDIPLMKKKGVMIK